MWALTSLFDVPLKGECMQRKSPRTPVLATTAITVVAATVVSLIVTCEASQAKASWLSSITDPIARVTKISSPSDTPIPTTNERWDRWLERMNGRPTSDTRGRTHIVDEQSGAIEVVAPLVSRPEQFNVEVTVSWKDDPTSGGCSLMLGVSDEVRYAFTATSYGRAAVVLVKTGSDGRTHYETVTTSKFVPASHRSRGDTLIVKIREQKLTFLVNDQRIAEIADTLMADDWMVGVLAQGHRSVALDNLVTEVQ
jgi:hypothetical protein